MITPVQDAKLLAFREDRLQTHLTVLVVFFDVGLFFGAGLKLLLA